MAEIKIIKFVFCLTSCYRSVQSWSTGHCPAGFPSLPADYLPQVCSATDTAGQGNQQGALEKQQDRGPGLENMLIESK